MKIGFHELVPEILTIIKADLYICLSSVVKWQLERTRERTLEGSSFGQFVRTAPPAKLQTENDHLNSLCPA